MPVNFLSTGRLRSARSAIQNLAGVVETEDEPIAAGILQTDDLRPRSVGGDGGDLANLLEGGRIEDVDAARLVIGDGDERAILGDGAADAVAGLNDPTDQLGLQQIDFIEPAIPAEDVCFICFFGRLSTGTRTFQVAFISLRPNSGGCGGSLSRYFAMSATSCSLRSPEVPQFGMPPGEP